MAEEIVIKFLTSFLSKINDSLDGIPKGLLKLLANELKFPLSLLFNDILEFTTSFNYLFNHL